MDVECSANPTSPVDHGVENAGKAAVQVVPTQPHEQVSPYPPLGEDAVLSQDPPVMTSAALGHVWQYLLTGLLGAVG